jgi:succinate dehydrogenase/fumarate reductase flavoprotein subunit
MRSPAQWDDEYDLVVLGAGAGGMTAALVGLWTDAHGQVCDGTDRPITGLYACGNDMHSVMDRVRARTSGSR